MIEKIKPGCPSTTLPCDFGDSVTFMEQEAKNTLKLQETDDALKKLKETVDTLDKECVKKIAPNSITGASVYVSLDATNNPELKEDKNTELVADSITDKNGVFPPTVEFGDVVRRTPSGVVWGATADVDPEGVEQEQPLAYVNVETLQKKLQALENKLNALLGNKADVIPKPASGTLLYGISTGAQDNQPKGVAAGTGVMPKFSVVMRTDNGQIVLPDQNTYVPDDNQAINKAYADKHYAGGGVKQRLLHYAAYDTGWGDGAAFEHTVPLPIRNNTDGVYYDITDSPKQFGADYAPDVVSLTIGDGNVAEADWSTNGVVIKRIDNVFGEAYSGTYTRWDSVLKLSSGTCHAFNTKEEFEAWKASITPEGSWSGTTPQAGYWVEYI